LIGEPNLNLNFSLSPLIHLLLQSDNTNPLYFHTAIMSRFFRQAGDSDSESEESDEELMSSGDEDAAPTKPTGAKPVMSRFLKTAGSGSSSSDEDSDEDSDESDSEDEDSESEVKKVVKSAKDKRLDEMEATGKVMDNGLKINDWVAISNGMCVTHVTLLEIFSFRRIRQTRTNGTTTK
jgi:Eukaryotic translation initiation factor 3 subunit 8 N-terminus